MQPEVIYGGDGAARFGAYARAFVAAFGTGRRLPVPQSGYAGRVLRGVDEASFDSLTDDPRRRVVFLLDAATLADLIGLTGCEVLRRIGYDAASIQRLVDRGTRFRLVLLPRGAVRPATWANLLELTAACYPEWAAPIAGAGPVLASCSYAEALARGGAVADVRAFLRDVLNVNALYAGDGFTRREGDPATPVYPEYVARNQPLGDFGSYCLIEFPVRPDDALPG